MKEYRDIHINEVSLPDKGKTVMTWVARLYQCQKQDPAKKGKDNTPDKCIFEKSGEVEIQKSHNKDEAKANRERSYAKAKANAVYALDSIKN